MDDRSVERVWFVALELTITAPVESRGSINKEPVDLLDAAICYAHSEIRIFGNGWEVSVGVEIDVAINNGGQVDKPLHLAGFFPPTAGTMHTIDGIINLPIVVVSGVFAESDKQEGRGGGVAVGDAELGAHDFR